MNAVPAAPHNGPRGLTAQELATWHLDGLVVPGRALDARVMERMRTALDELLAATPHLPPEGLVTPHIPGAFGLPDRMSESWLEFCTRAEILDSVAGVLGPDLVLWGSQVFCKPALTGLEIPWHQDGEYWPIRPLATCSVWIAIDDVTVDNGAMGYIPGSHRDRQLYPHVVTGRTDLALNRVLDPACYDPGRALYDELPSGHFSLHDVYLIHGSPPNRSGRRRAAFVMRFMPASSHFDRGIDQPNGSNLVQVNLRHRPLYLVRGQDRTGKTDLVNLAAA